jgi:DNA-binding transcriptional LysR family regulator
VNLAKAQKYGLTPGEVRRNAAALIASEEVGNVFTNGKAYNVVVWSTPTTRRSLTDIRNLPIDTPSGGTVRLGALADVRVNPNPNVIDRENDSRYIDVAAMVGKADLAAVDRPCAPPSAGLAAERLFVPGPRRVRRAPGGAEPALDDCPCWPVWRSCCCYRRRSAVGDWRRWSSARCPWPLSAACWRRGWAAASFPSVRSSASSRCSASRRGTAS